MAHDLREVHRMKQEGTLARNRAGIATTRVFSGRRTTECVARAVQSGSTDSESAQVNPIPLISRAPGHFVP